MRPVYSFEFETPGLDRHVAKKRVMTVYTFLLDWIVKRYGAYINMDDSISDVASRYNVFPPVRTSQLFYEKSLIS